MTDTQTSGGEINTKENVKEKENDGDMALKGGENKVLKGRRAMVTVSKLKIACTVHHPII